MIINSNKLQLYKKLAIATLLGFSSGMPLYVLYQTIPAWLRESGINLSSIGLFHLIGIPYAFKFLWAPLLERYSIPILGFRRGWMLLTQILLIASISLMGLFNPSQDLPIIIILTIIMTTFSATQDIVIDAYRREMLNDNEIGAGNAWSINAYRISSLIPGSLALILAEFIPWEYVFPIVASFMMIGLVTTIYIPEISKKNKKILSVKDAILEPLKEFFSRYKLKKGIFVLIFLVLYKLGDSMATAISTPFYLDIGFSKLVLGTVVKAAALWSSIAGGFLAGLILHKVSLNKSLWIFGFFQVLTILGFAWLASIEIPTKTDLFIIVSLEYLGVGLGTVAVVTYMFKICSQNFAASQIALFTAIAALPRTFANSTTGFIVEKVGYTDFFLICTACAIPGMLLLFYVAPWNKE